LTFRRFGSLPPDWSRQCSDQVTPTEKLTCSFVFRQAEELDCTSVFTTDRRDFSVYRLKGRKPFRLVPND
jgi:hypothetical protein